MSDCILFILNLRARFEYLPKWCSYGAVSVVTWLVPRETAAVSARSMYTIRPYTTSLPNSSMSLKLTDKPGDDDDVELHILGCRLTYLGQTVTNA